MIHGKLVPIDQEAGLRVAVSGADFQPASEARVSASVRDPTGEARETRLTPVTGRPGTFDRRIELRHEGEHRVEYKAELPGGETLARTAFFLAAPVGREGEDVAFRESEMRDVARLTGGRFLGLDEARALRHLPISSKVPFKERSVHWVAAPLFISILLMLLFTEWFGRRRCGLR